MSDQQKKRPRGAGDGGQLNVTTIAGGGWRQQHQQLLQQQQQQQQQAGLLHGGYNHGAPAMAAAPPMAPPPVLAPLQQHPGGFDLPPGSTYMTVREPENVAFLLAQQQAQQQQVQPTTVAAAAALAQAQMQQQQRAAAAAGTGALGQQVANVNNNTSSGNSSTVGGGLPFGLAEFIARPSTVLWTLDDAPQLAHAQQQQQQLLHQAQQQAHLQQRLHLHQQQQQQQASVVSVDHVHQQKPAAKKPRTSTGSANSTTSLAENKMPGTSGTATNVGCADEKKAEEGDDKSARYHGHGLLARTMPDGCVVPPVQTQRANGMYLRPSGRSRKGMSWNFEHGLWVPEGLAAPTPHTIAALAQWRNPQPQPQQQQQQPPPQVQVLQQHPQLQPQQPQGSATANHHQVTGISTIGGVTQPQQQRQQQQQQTVATGTATAPVCAATPFDPMEQSLFWSMDSSTVRRSTLDGAVLAAHITVMNGSMMDPRQAGAVVTPRDVDIQITHATLPPQSLLDIVQDLVLKMPNLSDNDIANRVIGRVKAGAQGGAAHAGRFLFWATEPSPQ